VLCVVRSEEVAGGRVSFSRTSTWNCVCLSKRLANNVTMLAANLTQSITMSSAAEGAEAEVVEIEDNVCANCGIVEIDDIKLEKCTDCDLVRYCSDKCRKEHREQHEEGVTKGRRNCTTKNYLHNPTATIVENARFVVCRCLLIEQNIHFVQAAVNFCVMVVAMPVT
jgi:hypothetical protein